MGAQKAINAVIELVCLLSTAFSQKHGFIGQSTVFSHLSTLPNNYAERPMK
jgi:hypothetical protein